MLEMNLFSPPSASGDVVLLFNLEGPFDSLSDIRDTGPNALPITRAGAITVGTDANGSYIDISGTNNANYLSFGGNALNGPNTIIEFEVMCLQATVGDQGFMVFDTRPASQNGNYSFLQFYQNRYLLRATNTALNSYGVNSLWGSDASNRHMVKSRLRYEYLEDKTYVYCDDVLLGTMSAVFSHLNQTYKISYHSYSVLTAPLRLYSFKAYKRK